MTNEIAANRGFWAKLINGDYGLAKTYWLCGVLVGIVVNIIHSLVLTNVADSTAVIFGIPLALSAYSVVWVIGVWRASKRYEGSKLWPILAKIAAIFGLISSVFMIVTGIAVLVDS